MHPYLFHPDLDSHYPIRHRRTKRGHFQRCFSGSRGQMCSESVVKFPFATRIIFKQIKILSIFQEFIFNGAYREEMSVFFHEKVFFVTFSFPFDSGDVPSSDEVLKTLIADDFDDATESFSLSSDVFIELLTFDDSDDVTESFSLSSDVFIELLTFDDSGDVTESFSLSSDDVIETCKLFCATDSCCDVIRVS